MDYFDDDHTVQSDNEDDLDDDDDDDGIAEIVDFPDTPDLGHLADTLEVVDEINNNGFISSLRLVLVKKLIQTGFPGNFKVTKAAKAIKCI